MERTTYRGAEAVASRVASHFAAQVEEERRLGQQPAAVPPDAGTIAAIIEAGFWASLRREEGYVPKISLAYLAPEHSGRPLTFERPLALEPSALARVAPAVERAGIHLGVWPRNGELSVWGTTRAIPPFCFVLEVAAPGLLVMKHHRGGESAKFVNVAVLEGDQLKVVNEDAWNLPECPTLLRSLLKVDASEGTSPSVNVLVQLAVAMRAHSRGGALLVVPSTSQIWRESIVQPIAYAVSPSFSELVDLVAERADDWHVWQEALGRAVDAIAGLTTVDGATILNDRYEVLAFGAKIARRDRSPRVESVTVTEPIEGAVATTMHPSELGGTRHLSAAQFVHDQQDAIAMVASQDGHFTIFGWSRRERTVHAHRVDALLL